MYYFLILPYSISIRYGNNSITNNFCLINILHDIFFNLVSVSIGKNELKLVFKHVFKFTFYEFNLFVLNFIDLRKHQNLFKYLLYKLIMFK